MERSKQTLLALSLAAVMLASLAGCSAQTQSEPASPPASSAVEAAQEDLWRKYVGLDGAVVGMRSFGESAPAKVLYGYFNITVEAVVEAVKKMIG